MLAGLTGGDPGPWDLVGADCERPAFLQAPDAGAAWRRRLRTADELDLLVTSKNDEVKRGIAADAEPDDWLFALVSTQTPGGYPGAGNYGVARMNGGWGSRVCVGLRPAGGGFGRWVRHDIETMLAAWERAGGSGGSTALLWVLPWDGEEQARLDSLAPGFVDICRRIRLFRDGGRIAARTCASRGRRIDAEAAHGDVGDHWTPVRVHGKALTIGPGGLRYERIAEILGPKYRALSRDDGAGRRAVAARRARPRARQGPHRRVRRPLGHRRRPPDSPPRCRTPPAADGSARPTPRSSPRAGVSVWPCGARW